MYRSISGMKTTTNWNKQSKKMFPIAQQSKHLKKLKL